MTNRQSQHLKGQFLKHFAVYGNVTSAALETGIARHTVYTWQEHDNEFALAFREAEVTATEHLEAEARRRAVEGVVTETPVRSRTGELLDTIIETKYSDTLLIFLLKARAPEKYRERVGVEHSGNIGTVDTELDSRIAQRLEKMAARGQSAIPVATGSQT